MNHQGNKPTRLWTLKCSCGGPLYGRHHDKDINVSHEFLDVFPSKLLAEMFASDHDLRDANDELVSAVEIEITVPEP